MKAPSDGLRRSSVSADWRLLGLVAGTILLVFGGYEVVERAWLGSADERVRHVLHLCRGVGASLLVFGLAAWYLTSRRSALPLHAFSPAMSAQGEGGAADWFISLRWLAATGAATAVFLSRHVLGLLPAEVTLPLWAGAAGLFAANVAFTRLKAGAQDTRAFLLWQIAADVAILTWLLHFSGGIENPVFIVYAFHVILAGILLSREDAYWVTAGVAALFLSMAFGEYLGLGKHYTLAVFPHDKALPEAARHAALRLPFVAATSGAFLALLAGTAYFTTAIMDGLRESQQHLLRTERLSALGQIVAFIAHEVNNPVGIISARSKLLQSRRSEWPASEFVAESVDVISRQADRVGAIVQSLLGLSRARAKPRTQVDVRQALSEAILIAAGSISKTGIVLEQSFPERTLAALADKNDLIHVFLNLINNAVDAMPMGGVLRVGAAEEGGMIEAAVSDTGEGISPEHLSRIFDPFFTTKPRHRGTGLGLAISLSLIKALGGTIAAESVRGKGSAFRVRLPLGPVK